MSTRPSQSSCPEGASSCLMTYRYASRGLGVLNPGASSPAAPQALPAARPPAQRRSARMLAAPL